MAAVAADAGVGYYLGGYQDERTKVGWKGGKVYTPSLVEFDMVERRYVNSSGPDQQGRGEGLMVYIPASTNGLLVYFGGVVQDRGTGELSGVRCSFPFLSEYQCADVEIGSNECGFGNKFKKSRKF